MVSISWEIGGKRVDARYSGDALQAALRKGIEDAIRAKVGQCVCPEHGQHPTLVGSGALTSPSFQVSGCCQKLIDEVKRRLS